MSERLIAVKLREQDVGWKVRLEQVVVCVRSGSAGRRSQSAVQLCWRPTVSIAQLLCVTRDAFAVRSPPVHCVDPIISLSDARSLSLSLQVW